MTNRDTAFDGGCACGSVRFRMEANPLFIHCCHCHWCQRETGSAFVLNALVEAERVKILRGQPQTVLTPSSSGKGQKICRCPDCRIAVWSHYAGLGERVCFVRVGTLDEACRLTPDIHIFTASKLPWVVIPEEHAAVEEYYDHQKYWPRDSLERVRRLFA
jgi:hypothetical protein